MSLSQSHNFRYEGMKDAAGQAAGRTVSRVIAFARQLHAWAVTERLGRRRYALANVQAGLAGFAVAFAPLFVLFLLPDMKTEAPAFIATLVAVIAVAFMEAVLIATSLARLRDLDRSPYWAALILIPYVNVLLFIWLALTKKQ